MINKKTKAYKNKVEYINKWQKKNYKKFSTGFSKEEYEDIDSCIKTNSMNKVEFIRWTYEKLKEEL